MIGGGLRNANAFDASSTLLVDSFSRPPDLRSAMLLGDNSFSFYTIHAVAKLLENKFCLKNNEFLQEQEIVSEVRRSNNSVYTVSATLSFCRRKVSSTLYNMIPPYNSLMMIEVDESGCDDELA